VTALRKLASGEKKITEENICNSTDQVVLDSINNDCKFDRDDNGDKTEHCNGFTNEEDKARKIFSEGSVYEGKENASEDEVEGHNLDIKDSFDRINKQISDLVDEKISTYTVQNNHDLNGPSFKNEGSKDGEKFEDIKDIGIMDSLVEFYHKAIEHLVEEKDRGAIEKENSALRNNKFTVGQDEVINLDENKNVNATEKEEVGKNTSETIVNEETGIRELREEEHAFGTDDTLVQFDHKGTGHDVSDNYNYKARNDDNDVNCQRDEKVKETCVVPESCGVANDQKEILSEGANIKKIGLTKLEDIGLSAGNDAIQMEQTDENITNDAGDAVENDLVLEASISCNYVESGNITKCDNKTDDAKQSSFLYQKEIKDLSFAAERIDEIELSMCGTETTVTHLFDARNDSPTFQEEVVDFNSAREDEYCGTALPMMSVANILEEKVKQPQKVLKKDVSQDSFGAFSFSSLFAGMGLD